jgi:hypothetical protein
MPVYIGGRPEAESKDKREDDDRVGCGPIPGIVWSTGAMTAAFEAVSLPARSKGGRPSAYDEVATIFDAIFASNPALLDEDSDIAFKTLAHFIRDRLGKSDTDAGFRDRTLRDHLSKWRQSRRVCD